MTRRSDPLRIETARRAATIARLVSSGRSAQAAAELVAEWEAQRGAAGRPLDLVGWEAFDAWLAERRSGP